MKWNEQTQQEAKQMVDALNETQWKAIIKFAADIVTPPSPEQLQADQDRRERLEAAKAQREADFTEKKRIFEEWKQKKLKGLKMPEAYDLCLGDVAPLCDYVLHEASSGHEGFFDTLSFMYDYGFKRGMAYQKKRNKA